MSFRKYFFTLLVFCFGMLGLSAQYDNTPIIWDFEEVTFDTVTNYPAEEVNTQHLYDLTGWMLNEGTTTGGDMKRAYNKWSFSTSKSFVGERSLLITNKGKDTVPPASYEDTKQNLVMTAYKEVKLPKGDYNFSMAWCCVGDAQGKDGLWVLWLPDNLNCPSMFGELSDAMKNRALDFHGRGKKLLNRQSYWQVSNATIKSDGQTTYRLVLAWVNDAANVSQPSVAVDYIQITPAESDDCTKVTELSGSSSQWSNDINVRWKGKADKYQVQWRAYSDIEEMTMYSDLTTAQTYRVEDAKMGMYDFWVRGICGTDTGMWTVCRNILVYSPGCINYTDLYSPDVECKYVFRPDPISGSESIGGNSDFPSIDAAQWRVGVIDNGPDSMSSRHTVNTIPGVLDPRTNYGLPTIPPGEFSSVRLGNWNIGAEGESITYTITVDSIYKIILLKYAVVFEDPNHNLAHQPRFTLRMFDEQGRLVGFRDCGSADFRPNVNLGADDGWHVERPKTDAGGDGALVRWKEWTTVGLRIDDGYVGQKIRVELKTYDCEEGGHYGYAYFTLGCVEATISGIACGERKNQTVYAPDGFEYNWYLKEDPEQKTLSTDRALFVDGKDTRTYSCDINMLGKSYCTFTLDAVLEPRFPKASFISQHKPSGCRNNDVYFHNASAVVSEDGIPQSGTRCDFFRWEVFSDSLCENQIDTFSISPYDASPTVRFPIEGGTFWVRLTAGMSNGNCEDNSVQKVEVPALAHDSVYIDTTTCINLMPVRILGKIYKKDMLDQNMSVRDTLVFDNPDCPTCRKYNFIHLTVQDSIKVETFDTICQGEQYLFNGQYFTESGDYYAQLSNASATSCDTSAVVHLHVIDSLMVEYSGFADICSGDSIFVAPFEVVQGDFVKFEILFDSVAMSRGFENMEFTDSLMREFTVMLPDSVRPDFYHFTMRCHTEKCGEKDFRVTFCVKYPESIIEQKWNNVIAVVSAKYNGGYEFDSYEWYRNNSLIAGETRGYLYIGADATFNLSDEYRVALVRRGETVKVMSCPLTPVERTDKTEFMVRNIMTPGMVFPAPVLDNVGDARGVARWWSVSGQLVAEQTYGEWNNDLRAPMQQGIYMLELLMGSERLMVKVLIY